jgi:multidrug transporter EmrE-like cation transporter
MKLKTWLLLVKTTIEEIFMDKLVSHLYIFLTIVFSVSSQFLMRWQASNIGSMPQGITEKFIFLFNMIFNPWVFLAFVFTGFSGVMWLLAMTKFELSYAYPFVSFNYILIFLLAPLLLNETISIFKIIGSLIILLGIVVLFMG